MLAVEKPPLPFVLKVVVAFVLVHGGQSLAVASLTAVARFRGAGGPPGAAGLVEALFPYLLFVCFDLLLAVEVVLRARSAIFWGIAYFATLTLFSLALFVLDPERWPALTTLERVRVVSGAAVNVALAAMLATSRAREALVR